MNYIELKVYGKKINLYGSKSIIENEKNIIEQLNLVGNEQMDRLIIQKCIDENKLKSNILYDGNTVYPFEKTIKEYRKMQKTDSLENMSEYMYLFFTNACGDIAHYDIQGFRNYYEYSLRNLENKLLKNNSFIPSWESDVDKIFKELKIGKYFHDREYISIDGISKDKLKAIIEECGWNVITENHHGLFVCFNGSKVVDCQSHETLYNHAISVEDSKAVLEHLKNFKARPMFDKDEYMENIIENRKNLDNNLNIREVVIFTDDISDKLSKLSDNVLYKCRLEVEEKKKNSTLDINIQQENYDIDICG